MKKILLTGANGFLGSACRKLLAQHGYEIHALDLHVPPNAESGNIHWHAIDLQDMDAVVQLMERIKPDGLIHLAWSIEKSGEKYTSNIHEPCVQIGLDLVEAFERSGGRRVVAAGTCAEYDWSVGQVLNESSPLKPQNIYAQSKHDLHVGLESFCTTHGLSFAWSRIFLLYGPNENPNRLMPHIIRSILADKPIQTTHGNQYRDYLHVEDVASALLAVLECDLQGPVNICSGEPVQLKKVVQWIADDMGGAHLVELGAIPAPANDVARLVGNNERLRNATSWSPKVTLEQGLREMIKSIGEGKEHE